MVESLAVATVGAWSRLVARASAGERLSGFIYGTIVALSVLVAGGRAYPDSPGRIAVLVVVTCAVFWIAHVYAHGLGKAVAEREHLSLAELRHIGHREAALVEAAVPLVVALLLGAAGVLSAKAAVWLAFSLGLGVLAAEGVVFAQVERLGRPATLGVVAANLCFGISLVALKLLFTH